MDVTCSAIPCPVILSATCVFYQGANLIYTGINNNDNLEIALQKIDAKFQDAGLGYIFQNGIVQLGPGLPVGLGGSLIQDTLITGAYRLSLSGEIEASKLITTGGSSGQFVKGDGSLDSTTYQPAGNYISALTGDGVATGPGSAIFTLANTGVIANTYGSSTRVPIITVDAKGRVTNLTTTLIAVPSSLLLFGGDVTGSGNTGSSVVLTLQTVNPNPQVSNTFLKFSVNGKGLVTSTVPVTNLDIESVLGYVPVPNSRTITINGVTQNLANNRSWTIDAALPSQTGNAGKYLFTDGVVATWQPVSSPILDLQQVTDVGNVTTNNIIVGVVGGDEATLGTSFLRFSKQSNSVSGINSADTFGYLKIPDSGVTEQIIPVSVNGVYADSLGEITIPVGTVTSVGLSMPTAFTVTNSPVTGAGTLTVTGAGTTDQYVRGDLSLGVFPNSPSGGGSSIGYYLNGSVAASVAGYQQLSRTPVFGPGTNYTTSTDGLIAQFLTDVGDPAFLNIPAGAWLIDLYFSADSAGGNPDFYVELYKYDGTTFTLLSTNVTTPEVITNGTAVDLYITSLSVPTTTLTLTDRLAIRVYVDCNGKTLTLYTEGENLSEVITTFSTGIATLNGLVAQVQYFGVGTTGTDFNIASSANTHTFHLPTASATNRGALSSADWTTFDGKFTLPALTSGSILFSNGTTIAQDNANFFWNNTTKRLGIGTNTPTVAMQLVGGEIVLSDGPVTNTVGNGNLSLTGTSNSLNVYRRGVTNLASSTAGDRWAFYADSVGFHFFTGTTLDTNIIFPNGNWKIGSNTTDFGFKLDVNGTARVNGQLDVISSPATTGTGLSMFGGTATITNSGGFRTLNFTNGAITVTGGSTFIIQNNGITSLFSSAASSQVRLGSSSIHFAITNNANNKITIKPSLFRGDSPQFFDIESNDASPTFGQRSGTIRIFAGEQSGTNGHGYISLAHNGTAQRGTVAIGAATTHASAILDVTSTTQGVLIPRMTLAQRDAITSPAAGLQVIVTGETGGEFVSMYNSSTASWVAVGSGSQSGSVGNNLFNYYNFR
jgi:hypothetical protein